MNSLYLFICSAYLCQFVMHIQIFIRTYYLTKIYFTPLCPSLFGKLIKMCDLQLILAQMNMPQHINHCSQFN